MEQGLGLRENVIGTPQGGVISPLLANIYLHYFDERMAELLGEGLLTAQMASGMKAA